MNLSGEVIPPVAYQNTPEDIRNATLFVCEQGFSVEETRELLETIGLIPYVPNSRKKDDYGRPIRHDNRRGRRRRRNAVG